MISLLLFACAGSGKPTDDTAALPTVDEVLASASDGDEVHFQGTVHNITFDSDGEGSSEDGEDAWHRLDGRWLLLRGAVPDGIGWYDITPDDTDNDTMVRLAWGLGVAIEGELDVPQLDETVEVSGTYREVLWNGHPVPVVEGARFLSRSGPALGAAGEACDRDSDCWDALVCDRASATCAPPEETDWASAWRDVDGHCYDDDDCPRGQVCDLSYVVPDAGEYTWRYAGSSKAGASLCVVEDAAAPEASCGRIASARDLAGGRFTEGRELCVTGSVLFVVPAEDGDSHLQLMVDEPIPYPRMDAPVRLFGATTEIGPPHKNPDRPQGAVEDPASGQDIVALGTLRWDGGHGWYEVHPVKAWWPVEAR